MKNLLLIVGFISMPAMSAVVAKDSENRDYKENFIVGSPEIQSMNTLVFGPQGILFVGDSKSAAVFAIETSDEAAGNVEEIKIEKVDNQLAGVLGTTPDNINIQDLAVHPISKAVYISVHRSDGIPALLRFSGNQFNAVNLENIRYSQASISSPVAKDAEDRRGRPLRKWAISDMSYFDDKLMVTGLSNMEFSSTFRTIPFPFTEDQDQASIEIWHAAHGRFETYAPIKTFTANLLNGEPHVIASYTCTPLVLFPLNKLKAGKHVKGRTVAELGSSNSPLDIITMENEGEKFLILANSNRAVMKISYSELEKFKGELTQPVEERFETEGVYFVNLPIVNALQIDKLDENRFVVLQRKSNGSLDLWTAGSRYL